MSEIVRCPDCDEKVTLKPGKAKVTCPSCGGRFAVEGPSADGDRPRDDRADKPQKKKPKRKYREEWDDDDEDDKPPKPVKQGGSLAWLWITLGIVAVVGSCCGGGVWGFYTFVKKARDEVVQRNDEWVQKMSGQPGNPEGRAKKPPQPDASFYPRRKEFEVDPALTKPSPVYLSDLQPFDVRQGGWPLGRDGAMGAPDGRWIVVGGRYSDHGIGQQPPNNGVARASYALGGQARRLKGQVALNDDGHNREAWGTALFVVYKNGQEVWRSPPIKTHAIRFDFDIDVSGARTITLETSAADHANDLHCVWLDPVLEK